MDSSISPIRNVAGRIITRSETNEVTQLVVQVDKNSSAQFKTLLEDCYGKARMNFLSIEHQNKGLEDSFNVNGVQLPLKNEQRTLRKFEELTKLLQLIGKSEKAFPIDKGYIGSLHCAKNLGFNFRETLTTHDKAEISQAHTLYKARKIADAMALDTVELTSQFFK